MNFATITCQPAYPGDWRNRALCAETDPEAFFPDSGESPAPAKKVCAGCEASAECLQDALDRHERFGVWGGLTPLERRVLSRQPVPARRCPEHSVDLAGGPVLYHCPAGHTVSTLGLQDAAEVAMMRQDAA